MARKKFCYPDLGIDVEVEILGGLLKFFPHGGDEFFGQAVVNTGHIDEAITKGLETPRASFKQRRAINIAIRRVYSEMGYENTGYDRRKKEKFVGRKFKIEH